jgi:predicted nucleic acid-binding protein
VPAAWDTSLASQIREGLPAHTFCLDRLEEGEPVVIAGGAVFETAFGYAAAAPRRPEFAALLEQFRVEVAGEEICRVLPADGTAFFVAAQIFAAAEPPAKRKDKRSKAARRKAWLFDVTIASTCWAAGHDVATENESDFQAIAAALQELYPAAAPLEVHGPPF